MSDNPFEAPQPAKPLPGETFVYQHDGSGRVYVRQIGVVAGLMIVQGVLMLLFAVFCLGYSVVIANMDTIIPVQERPQIDAAFPKEQRTLLTSVFGIGAGLSVILAIFYVTAGCYNLGYRARAFGIATLLVGLLTMMTCYCALTGIPLSVYGMIIYFNPAVEEAFRLRKTGMSKQEVLASFVR